jgi:hypothetical protein
MRKKKGDYEVGYGKPPKHTRWPKGQSGNPGGREKGHRGLKTDLEAAANTVQTIENKLTGRKMKGTNQWHSLQRLAERSALGDLKAQAIFFPLILQVLGAEDRHKGPKQLSAQDEAILAEILGERLPGVDVEPGARANGRSRLLTAEARVTARTGAIGAITKTSRTMGRTPMGMRIDNRHELLLELMRKDFAVFFRKAFAWVRGGEPIGWNWHLDAIVHQLDRVRSGDCRRLLVNIPPRNGKSLAISVAWVAWRLGQDPRHQFVCVSYSNELSGGPCTRLPLDHAVPLVPRAVPPHDPEAHRRPRLRDHVERRAGSPPPSPAPSPAAAATPSSLMT